MKPTKKFQWYFLGILSFMFFSTVAFAAEKVDFTGKWKLNESKSELGEGRAFSTAKMSVTLEGNAITIERTRTGRDGQERTSSETITLDGKENVVEGDNRSTTSTATWSDDGTTLTIKSDIEFSRQGETMKMQRTEVWTLGEDGKILKIQSDSSSARGDRSVTLVYEKE
ncbi:MAG: hypothetical protein ACWGNV_07935 [Bacteroidales bacterium]